MSDYSAMKDPTAMPVVLVEVGDAKEIPERLPLFDNIKAFLIIHVVLFHFVLFSYAHPVRNGYLSFQMLVVMPGFCFMGGVVSKAELTWKRGIAILKMLIIYIVFHLISYVVNQFTVLLLTAVAPETPGLTKSIEIFTLPIPIWDPNVIDKPANTGSVYWFLLCMVMWKSAMPFIDRLRYPVTTSILIGSLSLFSDAGFGSQQIFSFFPYFVMGYITHRSGAMLRIVTQLAWVKYVTFAVIVAMSVTGLVIPDMWEKYVAIPLFALFTCHYGVSAAPDFILHCSSPMSFGLRLVFYALSYPAMLGMFSLIPQRRLWGFTTLGTMSFNIYVWHLMVFILSLFLVPTLLHQVLHINDAAPYTSAAALALIISLSLMSTACLACPCWLSHTCCYTCANPPVELMFMTVEERQDMVDLSLKR